jgi:hypothetical protein
LDGSHIEDLVIVNQSPTGIALDVSGGKMYWQELDGSRAEEVITIPR